MCYISCPEETIGGWGRLRATAAEARVEFPLDVSYCEKCGKPFKPTSTETRCTSCSRFRYL
jgi:Zn finger protein HypA/HybF involved in hydrogenase expression